MKLMQTRFKRKKVPVLKGWTFVETLIVVGIVLVLTSAVGFMAFKYLDQAKQATAKSQIHTFELAVNAYYLDVKKYPTQEQGLKVLFEKPAGVDSWNGPYVGKEIPKDPWNNDYVYKIPGPNGLPFEIQCLGADGQVGGSGQDADISSAK